MTRAAVLRTVGQPLTIETIEVAAPTANEVLIRTAAVGVCHSDLHYMTGQCHVDLPVVPGHEASGVVEAVGDAVTYVSPGDHVITCMSVFCGECKLCTGGRPYLCEDPKADRSETEPPRLSVNGEPIGQLYHLSSYAERMLVHERAVAKISKEMPLDRAALIGCAVLTGFGAVTNTAQVPIGSSVAVIGCGGVGLSAILGAVAAGATQIIAVDVSEAKLKTATEFGATHTVNATSTDPVAAVRELSDGGVEFSFEALGRKTTAEHAFEMLRVGGNATIIGIVPEHECLEINATELLLEKTLQGSNMGSNRFRVDMAALVDRYLAGTLPLDDMITKRIDLDDINRAFEDMVAGTVARSVIVF